MILTEAEETSALVREKTESSLYSKEFKENTSPNCPKMGEVKPNSRKMVDALFITNSRLTPK